jgi:predicted DNA-binding transcriptional regulator AlpA
VDTRILTITLKAMTDIEQHITLEEVLSIVKFSKAYLYKLIRDEKMPAPVKIGRRSYWYPSEIKAAFSELTHAK